MGLELDGREEWFLSWVVDSLKERLERRQEPLSRHEPNFSLSLSLLPNGSQSGLGVVFDHKRLPHVDQGADLNRLLGAKRVQVLFVWLVATGKRSAK